MLETDEFRAIWTDFRINKIISRLLGWLEESPRRLPEFIQGLVSLGVMELGTETAEIGR